MLYRIHEKKYTEIYTMKLMKANAQEANFQVQH